MYLKFAQEEMHIIKNLIYRLILIFLVLSLSAGPIWAESTLNGTIQVIPSILFQQGPTDPEELEVFIDGVMAAQMEAYHIPGATISVVKDGKLFFAKGYGYADLENKKPVIANETLYRIGSVSKLFVGTAVMQLVEQGRLDLNTDINTYLTDFKIPNTYPEHITLAHLMTHTAGFEESYRSLLAHNADEVKPLGEYLANNMPARVRPPGEIAAYSNYGAGLAAYVVEEVSGMSFDDYVKENIYNPLDMRHSTFRQPLPLELTSNMAMGYTYENGAHKAGEFEYIGIAPSGSMSATSTDMAKFMIAHLEDGRYGRVRILQEGTAQEMHSRQFSHDPRINGMAYGFVEGRFNARKNIGHGGGTNYFSSLLMLLPEENVGLFVAFNQRTQEPQEELLKAFLNRYYPAPDSSSLQPPADFRQRAGRFTGSYRSTRSVYTTYEKVFGLMTNDVSATDDGLIFLSKQWVEVEPLVFHEVEGQQTMIFREDSHGRINYMFESPTIAYIKLAWYEEPMFHYILLSVSMVIFLSMVVWPIGALRNRLKGKKNAGELRSSQARWVAGGISALYVLFLFGMVIVLSDIQSISYGVPPLLPFILVLPLLAVVLTIGALGFTVLAWRNSYWGIIERVHYTFVTLMSLVFIWSLNYWNLLGFRF